MVTNHPFRVPAIRVTQPIGEFYLASIPVHILLDTCYSEPLKATQVNESADYIVEGAQRQLYEPRLRKIAEFVDTEEAAFPGSIILGANSQFYADENIDGSSNRWHIEINETDAELSLVIPSLDKVTSIIDGQHRLFSFPYSKKDRMNMEMACSIFFDLPKSFQAYIFATINSTQKPVSKSQTYELFGYNVDDEPPNRWSPDKLAVYLARRLNSDEDSPLHGRVLLAAENDFVLSRSQAKKQNRWMVSFASVVKGIAKLISQSPERDGYSLLQKSARTRNDLKEDKAPLRRYYKLGNDQLIFTVVLNYLSALENAIWRNENEESFIFKTSGFQAVFDIFRMHIVQDAIDKKESSIEFFTSILSKANHINFGDDFFSSSSGAGAIRIRRCFELCLGYASVEDFGERDFHEYIRVTQKR